MPRRLRCLPVGVVTGLCRKEGEEIFLFISFEEEKTAFQLLQHVRRGEGRVRGEGLAGEHRGGRAMQVRRVPQAVHRAEGRGMQGLWQGSGMAFGLIFKDFYLKKKSIFSKIYYIFQVAKVAGNFHFAPGEPYRTHRSHGRR